jgi:hypothetical protein
MAAPAGSSAVEAYKNTKSRGAKPGPAAAFVPKTSPEVEAKAGELHGKAIKNVWEAASAQDPFRPTGEFTPAGELPRGTYGGKKSRRRKTRRGGAMGKSAAQLLNELDDDPSEASLRNVLSELKNSGDAWTVAFAHAMERGINAHKAAGTLTGQLLQGGIGYVKDRIRKGKIKDGGRRKTRRRGGAMVKSMRELKADLERDPTEATLRNVLSDLKGADNGRLREYAEEMEERLEDDAPPYQNREDRVRMLVERVVGLLNMHGRGRRRKTTRRR